MYVNEPDTVSVGEGAARGTRSVGQRPVLAPGEAAPADYEALWARAFDSAGRGRFRRGSQVVVVKSVKAHGTVEWVERRFGPQIVVVAAHPLCVVSSWVSMGWFAGPMQKPWFERVRPDLLAAVGGWPAEPIEQVALRVGTLFAMQEEVIERHPEWPVVVHEQLCEDPVEYFAELFDQVGLAFSEEVRAFIRATDAPGAGHDITRMARSAPERWRRLSTEDRVRAQAILERLPLASVSAALT